MRTSALEFLACPHCGCKLIADTARPASDGHVMSGTLVSSCGTRYPIVDGIPRLTPEHADMALDHAAETTARRFGREWQIFSDQAEYYEQQFLDWIQPLAPTDFADKVVLEGGCGKGRHTALVARYGARAIVALDLGDAVEVAFRATRRLPNVHVVQGDITRPPVGRVFDIGFSIGVLHHLPGPQEGFRALCDRIVAGGRVATWVYGRESNEWIVRFVDPIRRQVTSRLPESVLYWVTLPPSLALAAALRGYRSAPLARRLPYGAYLHYISHFPAREVHHIVFDQLVTPVAHYLSEAEVRSWYDSNQFADVRVAWHNKNSWRASAMVTGYLAAPFLPIT